MNTGAPWPTPEEAEARVLGIQTKLHRWSRDDPSRRFDDLYNLVCDPAFLLMAWKRVRGNRGARSAGIDGRTARQIDTGRGVDEFLDQLRVDLKGRCFEPVPVRERTIPKPGTAKRRRLGIPTVRDRVVQAALKLVLEPIFEADFQPCSYGFRPNRRAQDAIAEIHLFASQGYHWVVEADIEACFDQIDHVALMDRVRSRVGDRRVLALVKAFLKAGVLTEDGVTRDTWTGTPQGGILSPLLANVALSVLDDEFVADWNTTMATRVDRARRRRRGDATYRLIRYADDFVIVVNGTRHHATGVLDRAATVLAPMGLHLSASKTTTVHINEGFDFLGWRIQRQPQQGSNRSMVYTWPSKQSLAAIKAKIRTITRGSHNQSLASLLRHLNSVLRGWTGYFRHGVSAATFAYLRHFTWRRVTAWLRHKHPRASWQELRRRYLSEGWWPQDGDVTLFNPAAVSITRYRYRGIKGIPTPWTEHNDEESHDQRHRPVESRMR